MNLTPKQRDRVRRYARRLVLEYPAAEDRYRATMRKVKLRASLRDLADWYGLTVGEVLALGCYKPLDMPAIFCNRLSHEPEI